MIRQYIRKGFDCFTEDAVYNPGAADWKGCKAIRANLKRSCWDCEIMVKELMRASVMTAILLRPALPKIAPRQFVRKSASEEKYGVGRLEEPAS